MPDFEAVRRPGDGLLVEMVYCGLLQWSSVFKESESHLVSQFLGLSFSCVLVLLPDLRHPLLYAVVLFCGVSPLLACVSFFEALVPEAYVVPCHFDASGYFQCFVLRVASDVDLDASVCHGDVPPVG